MERVPSWPTPKTSTPPLMMDRDRERELERLREEQERRRREELEERRRQEKIDQEKKNWEPTDWNRPKDPRKN